MSWSNVSIIAVVTVVTAVLSAEPVVLRAAEPASASDRFGAARYAALQRHVEVLADDALEGREAGRAGGRAAATYIMRTLKEIGVQPAGAQGTFFQPFGAGYRNILAMVRGAHPKLSDEFIIVSAHYDHVGYGSAANSNGPIGRIHNGADDNASGVAALLEVARALRSRQGDLSRSLLIAFWDAEEKGLWGSKHWLENPTLPVSRVRLMINIDMVGRLQDKLALFGTRSMPGLRLNWSTANHSTGLELDFPWQVYNNSDHYLFFQRRIPVTMVHTGLHEDYHRPSDDVEKLNIVGIAQAMQLVLQQVSLMANQAELPAFRERSWFERAKHQRRYEQPAATARPRLGVRLSEQPGGWLSIEGVTTGSAADRAGLRPGQVIRAMDGVPPGSVGEFRRQLMRRETVTLRVGRSDDARDLHVTLDGKPPRIGISWRTNTAEPNCVMISKVRPGSPAERAGLQRFDRVHQIDGETVGDSAEFKQSISNTEGQVRLLIERNGQLRAVVLDVPAREGGG